VFKVDHVLRLIPTHYVREEELLEAGFSPDIFCNVNTPEDYEAINNPQLHNAPRLSEGERQ
jgi:hypothetical protein